MVCNGYVAGRIVVSQSLAITYKMYVQQPTKIWFFRNYPFNSVFSGGLIHQFCSKKFYPTTAIHGSFYHL